MEYNCTNDVEVIPAVYVNILNFTIWHTQFLNMSQLKECSGRHYRFLPLTHNYETLHQLQLPERRAPLGTGWEAAEMEQTFYR